MKRKEKMMENFKKERRAVDFANNLIEFLADPSDLTEEELTEELKKEGVDIDGIVSKVLSFIQIKKDEQRLSWQRQAKEEREKKLKILSEIKNSLKTPELFRNYVSSRTSIPETQMSTYYLKLKEVSEKDEKSLGEDTLALKLLEKIEKGEKK